MMKEIEEWVFLEFEKEIQGKINDYLRSTETKLDSHFSETTTSLVTSSSLMQLIDHLDSFDQAIAKYRSYLVSRENYCKPIFNQPGFYIVDWDSFIERTRFTTDYISQQHQQLKAGANYVKQLEAVDIGLADNIEEIRNHLNNINELTGLGTEKFFVCLEKSIDYELLKDYKHVGAWGKEIALLREEQSTHTWQRINEQKEIDSILQFADQYAGNTPVDKTKFKNMNDEPSAALRLEHKIKYRSLQRRGLLTEKKIVEEAYAKREQSGIAFFIFRIVVINENK